MKYRISQINFTKILNSVLFQQILDNISTNNHDVDDDLPITVLSAVVIKIEKNLIIDICENCTG